MKKLLSFTALLITLNATAQMGDDCTDNFATIHAGYAFPESIVVGVDYYTALGLIGGIGTGYTFPKTVEVKRGNNVYYENSNSFDIYAYLGWRVYRKDYVLSIFLKGGYTMGDVEKLQPFAAASFLFPIGYKAISIEPIYIHGRGMAAKFSLNFKL